MTVSHTAPTAIFRGRDAIRTLCVVLLALWLLQPAWAVAPQALLKRAGHAIGPVPAEGLRFTGSITQYDPEQSQVPGGEPRLGAEAGFIQWRDPRGTRARTEWRVEALRPVPRSLSYVEIVDGQNGYAIGADSALPTRQAQGQRIHLMSRTRAALNARELLRTSPDLVRRMMDEPERIVAASDLVVGGRTLPALRYASDFGDMVIGFDRRTGLPAVIRMRDYDPIQGDSDFDLFLDDWHHVGALRYPFRQRYELNGKLVAALKIDALAAQAAPVGAWDHPAVQASATGRATGRGAMDSYQWFYRKQGFAVLLDSDTVYHDAQDGGLAFTLLAPSVWLATGGFYNSLVVELEDELVVYDAPHEAMSQALLRETAQRFPGKPIRHVIVTHAHMDHAGGLRSYVAAGITLVVGKGSVKEHLEKALRRPATLGIAELQSPQARAALRTPKFIEVDTPFTLGRGAIQAQAFPVVPNDHAEGMLFGYVPSARLGFVSDIWTPGRSATLPAAGTEQRENLLALVKSVRLWKLEPDQFAGGHGRVGSYMPVDALLARDAAP